MRKKVMKILSLITVFAMCFSMSGFSVLATDGTNPGGSGSGTFYYEDEYGEIVKANDPEKDIDPTKYVGTVVYGTDENYAYTTTYYRSWESLATKGLGSAEYKAGETASDVGTLTLTASVNASFKVLGGQSLIFDLAGHTITGGSVNVHSDADTDHEGTSSPSYGTVVNEGMLTIVDSSTEKSGIIDNVYGGGSSGTSGHPSLTNDIGATCVINDGVTITESTAGDNYLIVNHGTMTINDVTIETTHTTSSLVENGWQSDGQTVDEDANSSAVLTINGGSFTGGKTNVKSDDHGHLTINGGTFKNSTNGCVYPMDDTVITGGSFTADGGQVIYSKDADDTETFVNYTLAISGGKFTAEGSANVFGVSDNEIIDITGGTFTVNGNGSIIPESSKAIYTIHCGQFSAEDRVAEFLADGATLENPDGTIIASNTDTTSEGETVTPDDNTDSDDTETGDTGTEEPDAGDTDSDNNEPESEDENDIATTALEAEYYAVHTYEEVYTAPTCGTDGEEGKKCEYCGTTHLTVIPATGEHTWSKWVTTTEPTAETEGVRTRKCEVCGAEETIGCTLLTPTMGINKYIAVALSDSQYGTVTSIELDDSAETIFTKTTVPKEGTTEYEVFTATESGTGKITVTYESGYQIIYSITVTSDGSDTGDEGGTDSPVIEQVTQHVGSTLDITISGNYTIDIPEDLEGQYTVSTDGNGDTTYAFVFTTEGEYVITVSDGAGNPVEIFDYTIISEDSGNPDDENPGTVEPGPDEDDPNDDNPDEGGDTGDKEPDDTEPGIEEPEPDEDEPEVEEVTEHVGGNLTITIPSDWDIEIPEELEGQYEVTIDEETGDVTYTFTFTEPGEYVITVFDSDGNAVEIFDYTIISNDTEEPEPDDDNPDDTEPDVTEPGPVEEPDDDGDDGDDGGTGDTGDTGDTGNTGSGTGSTGSTGTDGSGTSGSTTGSTTSGTTDGSTSGEITNTDANKSVTPGVVTGTGSSGSSSDTSATELSLSSGSSDESSSDGTTSSEEVGKEDTTEYGKEDTTPTEGGSSESTSNVSSSGSTKTADESTLPVAVTLLVLAGACGVGFVIKKRIA